MTRKEELQKIMNDARSELYKIEDEERAKYFPSVIGKCYKFRNSYSCPEDEDDYWYIYKKILRVNENNYLDTFYFDIDKNSKITINGDDDTLYLSDRWIEIPQFEFDLAWNNILAKIASIAF